ncbi:cupin domain-containing protein [Rhizobium brockwellii]|uniref:cupin domain-containing protein n=1 Tax=Rhizobium brockwellii TaxID=3019932 RepID=UPI003F98336D
MADSEQPGYRPKALQPEPASSLMSFDHHTPVGSVVRSLRKEKKLSLKQLSVKSGVSVGMLSQVERDVSNPSVRVLSAVLHALGAPMSVVFEPSAKAVEEEPDFVRRANSRPILELGHLRKELLSSKNPHTLQLMILHIEEGGSSGEHPLTYPAEKGGLVLAGQIYLRVGDRETRLSAGDSFAFGPSIPHSFRHAGVVPAEVLWVIGPASLDHQL